MYYILSFCNDYVIGDYVFAIMLVVSEDVLFYRLFYVIAERINSQNG